MLFVSRFQKMIKLIILAECLLLAQIFLGSRVAFVGFDFTLKKYLSVEFAY